MSSVYRKNKFLAGVLAITLLGGAQADDEPKREITRFLMPDGGVVIVEARDWIGRLDVQGPDVDRHTFVRFDELYTAMYVSSKGQQTLVWSTRGEKSNSLKAICIESIGQAKCVIAYVTDGWPICDGDAGLHEIYGNSRVKIDHASLADMAAEPPQVEVLEIENIAKMTEIGPYGVNWFLPLRLIQKQLGNETYVRLVNDPPRIRGFRYIADMKREIVRVVIRNEEFEFAHTEGENNWLVECSGKLKEEAE